MLKKLTIMLRLVPAANKIIPIGVTNKKYDVSQEVVTINNVELPIYKANLGKITDYYIVVESTS